MFTRAELEQFQRDGYLIARVLVERATCTAMAQLAHAALAVELGPVEYEADVRYPGAPAGRELPGGGTVRRLLQAYARHTLFREWAMAPALVGRIRQLLGPRLVLSQAHHNCIMTKQPQFSSDTHWHQDMRYWSFQRPELVSVWLALGAEYPDNGCLLLLPGTHLMNFRKEQLDDALFLRPDAPENQVLIATQIPAELNAGDVLFFDCQTFHAAQRNRTDQPKFSVVFTYRAEDNSPLPDSRSALAPEIIIPYA